METKIAIMRPFFEDPDREFQIRELSRIVKINHTTVRKYLNGLVKESLLKKVEFGTFSSYSILLSRGYLNLKLFYNLDKLWKSGLIDELISKFEIPTIVLFGSYAHAEDRKDSDIDLCIISNVNIKKELELSKYEKRLNRKVSLHIFTKKEWSDLKNKNPNMVNSIINGIVILGELWIL